MNKLKKFFSVMFTITFFVIFIADVYAYEHDPMQDPDAAKDIIADVNAVTVTDPVPIPRDLRSLSIIWIGRMKNR